ncbi:MAG: helix-turn-helix domain-containing protein [Leptolyngbyaceae bacterium]|nr:helix-turn-helix domain-containing protein [Leptolyngbyaceae bacterium]
MTQSAAYCLSGAQNSKLIISHDELRSLFAQVESEFCQSDIYQKAFQGLNKRLGSTPKWLRPLIRAIGREAIRLTLRQLVLQYQNDSGVVSEETDTANPHSSNPHSSGRVSHEANSSTPPQMAAQTSNRQVPTIKPANTSDPIPSDSIPSEASDGKEASDRASGSTSKPSPVMSAASLPNIKVQTHSPSLSASQPAPQAERSETPHLPDTQMSQKQETERVAQSGGRSHLLTKHEPEVDPSLRTIGEALKQARLEKGLTIQDVYNQTRVATYQIEAIESGHFDRLPEKIYVKGFIRQIALFLGVDYQVLMQHWPQDTASTHRIPSWVTPASTPMPQQKSVRPAHLYLGYAALMASAAGGLVWANQSQAVGALGDLELPTDLPQMFEQLISRFNNTDEGTQRSRYQRDQVNSGAIASPEIVTVESSNSAP